MLSVRRGDEGRRQIGLGFRGMEENELEEGEACSGQEEEDDSCIDPDIALSYIGERLHDVLGHFQKDFEGGVSAENLGSKFGGYGSFLPTYQRSPPMLAQPKSPPKAPNTNAARSPYAPSFEGTRQNPSTGTWLSLSKNNTASASPLDNSSKNNIGTVNDEKPIPQHDSLSKPVNSSDQKTLKVRIKVGPDNILARNNAAIYSGLGLDMSPSSSLEDSPDGSGGLTPEFPDMPDESPRTILQMMTCFSVPGGFLLSPLRESLFQLTKKDTSFVKNCKTGMLYKGIPEKYAVLGDLALPIRDVEGCSENKMKSDDKKGRSMEVKNLKYQDDIDTNLNRETDIESPAGQELVSNAMNLPSLSGSRNADKKAERQIVGESVKGGNRMLNGLKEPKKIQMKERIPSPDLVKHKQLESLENMENNGAGNLGNETTNSKGKFNSKTIMADKGLEERNICNPKGASFDLQREVGGKVKEKYDPGNAHSDRLKGRKERISGPADHIKHVPSQKATPCEEDGDKIFRGKDQFEGKRKLGKQTDAALLMELSKDNLSGHSSASLKEKKKKSHAKANYSEKKFKVLKSRKELSGDSFKELHGDVLGDINAKQLEKGTDMPDLHSKDEMKVLKPEHEEPFQSIKTSKERSGGKKIDKPPITDVPVNEPTVMPLMGNAQTSGAAAAPYAPVVIEEHWVCCDACQKWRLLPYWTNPDQLPKSWQCNMLNWLHGMNSCEIGEEETTKALNALYLVPAAPETGASLEGHNVAASGITTTNAQYRNQKLERNLQSVPAVRKRKNGPKDASNVSNHSIQSSNPVKMSQQASIKNRSLNNASQYPFETNSLDKVSIGHTRKSTDFSSEKQKHKQKEKHKNLGCYSNGGDFMEKSGKQSKPKSKREVEQDDSRAFKKIKNEGSHYLIKDCYPDHDVIGKEGPDMANGLSTKTIAKNRQKHNNISLSKDLKCETKGSLSVSSRRLKNEVQDISNGEIKETFSTSDLEKPEGLRFAAKKRKPKEWQDSQEAQASLNEVLSDNEMLKSKKARVSNSDGMGSSASKIDGGMDKRGSSMRAILPSSREHLPDGMDDEGSYAVGKEYQLGQCRGTTSQQALDCVDPLKSDMAYAQASTAATSSSSKVSSSRRSKANFQELKGSPVESVSSSPLRISNTEKLFTKRKSVVKEDAINVGSSVLRSPKRCSDSEVDGESDRSRKIRKETSYSVQRRPIENYKAAESGVLDSVRRPLNRQSREANQLSGGKVEDEMLLKRGACDGVSTAEFEEINVVSGTRNLMDLDNNCLHESPYKDHAQDLDKLNKHHQVDGSSHQNFGKNSSLKFKGRHRSSKSDMDNSKLKVSGSFCENKDSYSTKNGSSCRQKVDLDSHQHSTYLENARDKNYSFEGKDEKDCSGKKDCTARSSTGRRDNNSSFGIQESLDEHGPSVLPIQLKDLDSRVSAVGARCGKSNVHDGLQLGSSYNEEKSPNHLISGQIDLPELPFLTGKAHSILSFRDKQGTHCPDPQKFSPVKESRSEVPSCDAVNADTSKTGKQSRQPNIQNGLHHPGLRQATPNDPDTSSPIRKDGHSAAHIVMKEARDLKHTANRLKSEGLELESTSLYFQAALKFLHCASLMEPLSFDSAKQGDPSRSMQMYFETAKLCEFCAHEYERCKETAAAALAYKCVEVAYLKSAYYKYPNASKDQHELQAALQILQPGESPSSSASDVDNLNNQGTLGKAMSARGVTSPQVAGNHVIAACNHPHVMRLLSYTSDVNCAFEATRKSKIAIAAASASLERDRADGMSSVRKVLDFNFDNVEGLLRLVRLSMESINC
ncbi:cysteine-tryptophan domain-containing zinc finger protein 7-like [Phoenix dactylifera]|uniref:Cysteine-tryptophan domain-containing zinc finger protein 7-like n=1 Tax=Phoenix dactylifera TaxID=42345 RepID=A0A8B7CM34_PHODC|nr:cysteine-tryptophan domain-containing zinc finger protein 7-like [Phoenix dactylifera]